MKKIFIRLIQLLLLVSILGASLNMWGQTLFVYAIEEALFERDLAYIDQVFYRLNIILSLVSGEIQKSNNIREQITMEFSKYRLEELKIQLTAEQLYLFDEHFEIVQSTGATDEVQPTLELFMNNHDKFSMDVNPNTFGYYIEPTNHKIKIISQQYFKESGLYIIEVYDLIQMMLNYYPVAVYETLYPYILSVNSEYVDRNTQFTVNFLRQEEVDDVKEEIDISALKVGDPVDVRSENRIWVYQLVSLDTKLWLDHPLLLKTITYENLMISKMLTQMYMFIVAIILLLIIIAFTIYYKVIYKGLISKLKVLNNQMISHKTGQISLEIDETGIIEVDLIVNNYKELERLLTDRENFIAEMGFYDTITGIGNIYLLEKELEKLINIADENNYLSLISIHLKNDREIVEQLTNENIQMFLGTFMTQIKTAFGSDSVYRTSDYTFAALSNQNYEFGVIEQIQKLQEYMKRLLPNNEIKLKIIAARYPEHGLTAKELIDNIEIASLNPTHNTVIFYSQSLKDVYKKQLELEIELKFALKNNEIFVVYQPVVNPFTTKIAGVEALVRWKRKNGTYVSPEIFIPIAEKLGIIEDIDKLVFEKSCRMLLLWEEIYEEAFFVSINTSPIWFTSPEFIGYINEMIIALNVDPSKICIEIIETCLIEDINLANGIILKAKDLGIKIALDDFGKGYSSLNYLRNLEIDKLKIDKDFLLEMDFESQEYNLIDSIVDMAHHMNFEVVVEGVEELPQLEYLKALNVELIQGYLFSKPVDKKEISQLLLEGGIINPR